MPRGYSLPFKRGSPCAYLELKFQEGKTVRLTFLSDEKNYLQFDIWGRRNYLGSENDTMEGTAKRSVILCGL